MADHVILKHTYCDEHMDMCDQAHDTATDRTKCIEGGINAYGKRLEKVGYYYTGHHRGEYTYTRRQSAPLAMSLDWIMAQQLADSRQPAIDPNQDW